MVESQQDVFNELLRLAGENRKFNGSNLVSLQLRFAAAGKVPVPRAVGEMIDAKRANHEFLLSVSRECYDVFCGDTGTVTKLVATWVVRYYPLFVEAYNHGWTAEEEAK